MTKKIVNKYNLKDPAAAERDLAYWLSRPPEERLAAVDALRKVRFGDTDRLKRVVRVIERSRS